MLLELAILKNFDPGTYEAGVQLAGSLTTYFDDVPVSRDIPTSALIIGNRVILAIPGDNPKDAVIIATWSQGTPGGGMQEHGNEYHNPAFAEASHIHAQLHAQNTDKTLTDADSDTRIQVEKTADEDKVRMSVKGVEALVITDSGIVNLPKQSYAKAYLTADQSIPNETYTRLTLNAEDADVQNEFDTSTNRFTVKEPGLYLVIANVLYLNTCPAGPHQYGSYIWKNGTGAARLELYSPAVVNCSVNIVAVAVLSLAANDYLEMYTWQGSGGTRTAYGGATSRTHLVVVKIG